jgi:hypothetical protein
MLFANCIPFHASMPSTATLYSLVQFWKAFALTDSTCECTLKLVKDSFDENASLSIVYRSPGKSMLDNAWQLENALAPMLRIELGSLTDDSLEHAPNVERFTSIRLVSLLMSNSARPLL